MRVEASRHIDDDEPTVTLTAAERKQAAAAMIAEEHVVAVAMETSEGGSLWDPLPVTLPTYVGTAVAKRTFRTIELGEAGTWSSGHSDADSETVAATAAQAVTAKSSGAAPSAAVDDDEPGEVAKVVNA